MSHSRSENSWTQLGVRLLVNTAAHPLEYAKVLIQIGHEPIKPYPSKTLFGKPALALPNIFQYLSYIKSVDGFYGCYRGLGPKLCASALSYVAFAKAQDYLRPEDEEDDETKYEVGTPAEKRLWCLMKLVREGSARSISLIISQPFHVIAIRMMAQFLGGEPKYVSFFGSVQTIYQENGIFGFFSGLIPRILGELASLTLSTSLIFVINNYAVEDFEVKKYVATSMNFIAATVTYPFQVVGTCMAVTGAGIPAGQPPNMPMYTSWIDCWSHLQRTNQLKRGSSLIWRYYLGPQVTINGQMVPVSKRDFIGRSK